jgi:lipopolysaccharide transport system permease protein
MPQPTTLDTSSGTALQAGASAATSTGGAQPRRDAVAKPHFTTSGDDAGDSLPTVAREVWSSRDLLAQLALRDIRIRYKQAVMGFGWALLMPLVLVLAGAVIRLVMAQAAGVPVDRSELGAVALKAVPWGFFVGSLGFAVNSLVGNINLITKIYFPREVLPLSAIIAQGFDSAIASAVLLIVLPFLGAKLTTSLFWVPLLAFHVVVLTLGVGMLVSCANLFFRDVKYLVQIVLMFGVFGTPVFFEPAMLGPRGAVIMALNPLTAPLEGLRLAIFEGHSLFSPIHVTMSSGAIVTGWNPMWLAASAAFSILLLLASVKLFRRLQFVFAERV